MSALESKHYNIPVEILVERINLKWYVDETNFGDAINPFLVEAISGVKVDHYQSSKEIIENYLVIGSILEQVDEGSIVWGTGLICSDFRLKKAPRRICAVRGPLTREIVQSQGIPCPRIYGDPLLLYPRFYKPQTTQKYKLGIIPHYVDQDHTWIKHISKDKSDIIIINVREEPHKIIRQICSCEKIASSSLHGIIAADAYGIPSKWIKLSNRVFGKGFKFRDYFASVHKKDSPFEISSETTLPEVLNQRFDNNIDIDLTLLYEACPFRSGLYFTRENQILKNLLAKELNTTEQLKSQLRIVESSKFWKLRKAWFKLKSSWDK